jgi:hypothetical protein
MYIGGMGCTGKTQVLKALMKFFETRNESHRFVVAALLGGSTYHYLFGINEKSDDQVSNIQLANVRSQLQGVKYVFLDEVSMLLYLVMICIG